MGARLVGKFAYIKNMEHIINQLEYAGNKIAHQDVVFEDGRVKEQDGCTKLKLSDEEIKSVSYIKLFYKDGGYKKLDYDDYTKLVSNKEEKITISKIEALDGENLDEFEMNSSMVENKEYHELKDLDIQKYLNYIAERPGAEKEDGHGLFGINGNITTEEAVELALEHPDSIFWTCIISMRGEDGKRTGFDNRAAWKRLVIAKAPEVAKAYNISLENLVVNAGYHCNTDNDHVHITFYSKDKREGFVKGGKEGMQKASKRVLSLFLNDIFKDDVKEIQNLMDRSRQSIKTELKNHMLSLSQNDMTDEKLVNMFVSLSDKIAQHKGKHDYAYLNSNAKQSVNELLRYALKSNDNLSVLFKQLMDSKLEYIHMYNQFPEDVKKRDGETKSDYNQRLQNVRKNIDDKIQEAEDKIFSPQKGQATLQNIIVHSISDYIKERASPLENQPATKEKNIFDNQIPPPPADKPEILATMDDFRNLVTFDEMEIVDKLTDGPLGDDWIDFTTIREALAENRAVLSEDELDTIEEIDDYYIAELPDELSEIQDDITADVKVFASETRIVEKLTEPPKKATATKGKNADTPKSPQYEFSKSIYNDISESAYKACSTLFNQNECNTNLQKELLIQLKQMYKLSSDEKKDNKEYKECAARAFKIMMTDTDFYDKFNSSIEKHTEEYLKENNYDAQSREIVTEYINNVRNGDKLNSAHWYSMFFSDNINDNQYFQIMKAFEHFNAPLRKGMRKNIIENFDDISPVLKEIREIKENIPNYLKNDEVKAYVKEKIRSIWNTATNCDEYQNFIESYLSVIGKYMNDDISLEYKVRFESTLNNVEKLMRPHFYLITQAEHLDELQLTEAFKSKELFSPVKILIKKCLDNSITDYSYSSQFLKQELLKDKGKDNTKEILRCLYSKTDIKSVIDKWAENVIKASSVEDVTKYYEGFQSFLRGEPCEYENLFNYNKLTNYIRYYKANYVEQAYKQIKKSVKTDALKQHLVDVFDGDLQQNNKDWIKLYGHIKNSPKEDDENAINKYQSQSKELVLNIFNRVLHKNKDVNLYISQVNTEFNKHSGDNNISLTLENRFENDIYSGDLYTEPNRLIFTFAEKLPQNYFKMILHSEKSKQLLKPIYKNITDNIYDKLSLEGDNDVKILISETSEISQKFGGCDYPERLEIMNECEQLTANLLQSIDNSELSEQINKLEKHLQKEITLSTPEELQADIEKLKTNFRNGSLSLPYNYIIFSMGENKNETYGKTVMSAMKNEVKDLNSEIYKNLYEVLSHRKGKRDRSPVYKLMYEVNNARTKEERNKITTKMLEEFRQNPNFNKQFNKVKSNFCENLSKCCTIDNTENIFEQTILFGDFGSLKNTIEFMAQESENIVKKINRQKAFRCVKLMCGTLAYALYDEANHQMQRNLSQKNTLNRGINKFITKKQNQQQNNYLSY